MAAGGLDGAGQAKMGTLETANEILQRVHAQTERYALAVKQNQNSGPLVLQIKRGLEPLVGLLKAQFGLIADQTTGLLLAMGRGGSDNSRVRTLREGVAQLRSALEIAQRKVKEQHTKDIELAPE